MGLLTACGAPSQDLQTGREYQADIELSVQWSDCDDLAKREAGFAVSVPSEGLEMDGAFNNSACKEPMRFALPSGSTYEIQLEGGGTRSWTYEQLEERDFHITW